MCQIHIESLPVLTALQSTVCVLYSWKTTLDKCGHTQFPAVCIKVLIESGWGL